MTTLVSCLIVQYFTVLLLLRIRLNCKKSFFRYSFYLLWTAHHLFFSCHTWLLSSPFTLTLISLEKVWVDLSQPSFPSFKVLVEIQSVRHSQNTMRQPEILLLLNCLFPMNQGWQLYIYSVFSSKKLYFPSFSRFSVEVFFGLLLAMMILSTLAFGLIDNLKTFDPERVMPGKDKDEDNSTNVLDKEQELEHNLLALAESRTKLTIFLSLITFICFISNGALPSIQVSGHVLIKLQPINYHWLCIDILMSSLWQLGLPSCCDYQHHGQPMCSIYCTFLTY